MATYNTSDYQGLSDYLNSIYKSGNDWTGIDTGTYGGLISSLGDYSYRDLGKKQFLSKGDFSSLQQAVADKLANLSATQSNIQNASGDSDLTDRSFSDSDLSALTANNSAELENQAEAAETASANKNAGLNSSAASLTGSQASTTDAASTANSVYSATNAQNASTQADYLEKMGQAVSAECKAKNMNTANYLNTFGALLGSDERMKKGIMGKKDGCTSCTDAETNDGIDDEQLKCAVYEFYQLKKCVDELKRRK